jgi:hypothetical protein
MTNSPPPIVVPTDYDGYCHPYTTWRIERNFGMANEPHWRHGPEMNNLDAAQQSNKSSATTDA